MQALPLRPSPYPASPLPPLPAPPCCPCPRHPLPCSPPATEAMTRLTSCCWTGIPSRKIPGDMSAPCLTTTDGPPTAAREAGQAGPAGRLAGLPAGASAPAWLVPVDCSAGPAACCIGCPVGVVLPFLAALCCREATDLEWPCVCCCWPTAALLPMLMLPSAGGATCGMSLG